ncbi:MAG: hypothetical protein GFH27_549279n185 [Chloroflexi bacterium AL-W]|nr:hypothetical protein [Chloroflexi bacterium AL-N1]NOK65151.1 hypothetical protein [Chloroflexi bacterium AL-N10]NOK72583.1 hypothetical protein [Chloroflexi bacterium AL-N5]NOK79330.1 hypothetical protein [Chloroflexi bacterium AL-W]NOK87246.1 hypothetical protein [Chloroflexi bacterium AL-N15]
MNTLYFVRHGENLANLTKEFSHKKVDYSLTPKGVLQAQQTAAHFANQPIDASYTSPLKRALETAQIIVQPHNLDTPIVEAFREINVGSLEGQMITKEVWQFYLSIIDDWRNNKPTTMFPDGENLVMLRERMRGAIKDVVTNRINQHIIIVAHDGVITGSVSDFCANAEFVEIDQLENHNCSITRVTVEMDHGVLAGQLEEWTAFAHLSGEAAALVSGMPDLETREAEDQHSEC